MKKYKRTVEVYKRAIRENKLALKHLALASKHLRRAGESVAVNAILKLEDSIDASIAEFKKLIKR